MRDPYDRGRRTLEEKREDARSRVLAIVVDVAPTRVTDPEDATCLCAEFHLNGTALIDVAAKIEAEFEIELEIEELLDMAMAGPRFGRLLDLVVDRIDE